MASVEDLFAEYTSLRSQGLQSDKVQDALRAYMSELDDEMTELLFQSINRWEEENLDENKRSANTTQPIKAFIECETCGKQNQLDAAYCYSCGSLMPHIKRDFTTMRLGKADRERLNARCFREDSTLVLKASAGDLSVELQPGANQELILGRITDTDSPDADVDLSEFDGEALGVSRRHVSLMYDPEDFAIKACDVGSANGTFVNGQKLRPHDYRILQHGDALCMGRLVLHIKFRHTENGNEE